MMKRPFDRSFFYLVLILVIIGLVFIADISTPQALNYFDDKFYFLKQQAVWAGIGVVAMVIVSNIHYNFWKKIAVPFFFITILLLVVVFIPGVGLSALGARRWISFGSINFQPSEVVKLALALYLAKIADASKNQLPFCSTCTCMWFNHASTRSWHNFSYRPYGNIPNFCCRSTDIIFSRITFCGNNICCHFNYNLTL